MSYVSTVSSPPFMQKCITILLLMRPTFDSTPMVTIQDNFSPVDLLQKITTLYVTGITLNIFFPVIFRDHDLEDWPDIFRSSAQEVEKLTAGSLRDLDREWAPGAPDIR